MEEENFDNILQQIHTFYSRRTYSRFLVLWGLYDSLDDAYFHDDKDHPNHEIHVVNTAWDKLDKGIFEFMSWADLATRKRFIKVLQMEMIITETQKLKYGGEPTFEYVNELVNNYELYINNSDIKRIVNLSNP